MKMSKPQVHSDNLSVGLLNINSFKRKHKLSYVNNTLRKGNLHILAVFQTKLGPNVNAKHVNIKGYRLWTKISMEGELNHIYTKLRPDLVISGLKREETSLW